MSGFYAKTLSLSFVGCLVSLGLVGCKDKDISIEKSNHPAIGEELVSLGRLSGNVFAFELKCKTHDSKLFWVLETKQRVLGLMGLGGYSGADAEEMAKRLINEMTSIDNLGGKSSLRNRFKIEFLDKNGFVVASSQSDDLSNLDFEGKESDPLRLGGWFYRGVMSLKSEDIARIENYKLNPLFSDEMQKLHNEAFELVEKKKAEKNKEN